MESRVNHSYDNIESWPLYKLSQDRAGFTASVNAYTLEKLKSNGLSISDIVAKTLYLEQQRIKTNPWKVDPRDEKEYFKKLQKELQSNASSDNKDALDEEILKRIINRYSEEIVGVFKPSTFKNARKYLTGFFKRLLNSASGRNHRRLWGSRYELKDRFKVNGYVDELRSHMDRACVVLVPTHHSNLDSIMIGYAMDQIVKIPAFSYGAGLNLYDAELVAYFINRLGAYKLDRRKKNPVYREVLMSFSTLSIERGVNSIFFPGGTRSRNGALEKKVKLGLFGTVIDAQRRLIQKGSDRKVVIIPVVIGYHFVLEAAALIDQYLSGLGKEKYTKDSGKGVSIRSVIGFLWEVFSTGSEINLTIGKPMDVFGNSIDAETSQSLDERNHPIEIEDYFKFNGVLGHNKQREYVYARLLGRKVVESYHKYNTVLSSHVVSFCAFRYILSHYPKLSIFELMNVSMEDFVIEYGVFENLVSLIKKRIIQLYEEQSLLISPEINLDTEALIEDGIKHMGTYHADKPLINKDDGNIATQSIRLLYFYHNRMLGYELEMFLDDQLAQLKKTSIEQGK